ncbi:MAG: hypothetical protein ABIH92_04185 [Nanoarchaeota archaeon]
MSFGLMMLDPRGLVKNIGTATGSEDDFCLGKFSPKNVRNRPMGKRRTEYRGRAPITRTVHDGVLSGLAGIKGERVVGYLEIRRGYVGEGQKENPGYEEVILRVEEPIELKNGNTIPDCRVRVTRELKGSVETYAKEATE